MTDNIEVEKRAEVNNKPKWEKVYEKDESQLPWQHPKPPAYFEEIINSDWVKPCDTLDVGCGLGTYSNYLAEKGFNVVGIDLSETAINKNNEHFRKDNLIFKACDSLNLGSLGEKFSFVIDISLFHHIKPEDREKYAKSVADVTVSDAKLLLCCFSINDPLFDGKGEFYGPDTDTTTFVLSEDDIRKAFSPYFDIESIEEVEYGKISLFKNSVNRKRWLVKMHRLETNN